MSIRSLSFLLSSSLGHVHQIPVLPPEELLSSCASDPCPSSCRAPSSVVPCFPGVRDRQMQRARRSWNTQERQKKLCIRSWRRWGQVRAGQERTNDGGRWVAQPFRVASGAGDERFWRWLWPGHWCRGSNPFGYGCLVVFAFFAISGSLRIFPCT
jgi:hypothetical protein